MVVKRALAAAVSFGFFSCCAKLCGAASVLRGNSNSPLEKVSVEEVQRSLLEEINLALRHSGGVSGERLDALEIELAAMFAALPKNQHGKLGHATVHYALHRLFMDRHAWYFRGLEPSSNAWNSTTPAAILKDRVPTYIQELFEQQLGGRGFGLQELAVLAATLEHLVNNEANERLRDTYAVMKLPVEGKLQKDQFDEVMDTYVISLLRKANITSMSPAELNSIRKDLQETFAEWPKIQVYVREMVVTFGGGMDFAAANSVVAATLQNIGSWHKSECQSIKEKLISFGDRKVGRVPLTSYYTATLSSPEQQGRNQAERVEYLRSLGALEEADPHHPSLLIANYLASPPNCFGSSPFFSICCQSECEGLLRTLEWEIAAPAAKPERIRQLVSKLPSSTVGAPRELGAALLRHLDEIASQHGGDIPIHGRLFAQWLHHAYPRECPYPHAVGTTHPQTPDEWMANTGNASTHTHEEIQEYIRNKSSMEVTSDMEDMSLEDLPWSDEEELLVVRPPSWSPLFKDVDVIVLETPPRSFIRNLIFACSLAALFWLLQEKIMSAFTSLRTSMGSNSNTPSAVLKATVR